MPALGLGITAVASVPGILDTFGRKITRARVGTTVHAFMPVAGNPPTAVPMIQWTLNGADLPGATGVYLTVPDLAGTLSWRGTDSDGISILAETSAEVTGVTAEVTAPPVITLETAPTDDGLAPVTAGESLSAVLGRLTQTGLATTTGTGGVTTVATLLSGGDVVTDLTAGLTLDTLRFTYSATGAEDLVEDVAVSITVEASPPASGILAGELGFEDLVRGQAYTLDPPSSLEDGSGTYSATDLPVGMAMDATTGQITGTPITAKEYVDVEVSRGDDTVTVPVAVAYVPGATIQKYHALNVDIDYFDGNWTTETTAATVAELRSRVSAAVDGAGNQGTREAPKAHRIFWTGGDLVDAGLFNFNDGAALPTRDFTAIVIEGQGAQTRNIIFGYKQSLLVWNNWRITGEDANNGGGIKAQHSAMVVRACKLGPLHANEPSIIGQSSAFAQKFNGGLSLQIEYCWLAGWARNSFVRASNDFPVDVNFTMVTHHAEDFFHVLRNGGPDDTQSINALGVISDWHGSWAHPDIGQNDGHLANGGEDHLHFERCAFLLGSQGYTGTGLRGGADTGFREVNVDMSVRDSLMAVSGFDGIVVNTADILVDGLTVAPCPGVGSLGARVRWQRWQDNSTGPSEGYGIARNIRASSIEFTHDWIDAPPVQENLREYNLGDMASVQAEFPNLSLSTITRDTYGESGGGGTRLLPAKPSYGLHPTAMLNTWSNLFEPPEGWANSGQMDPADYFHRADLFGEIPAIVKPTLAITAFSATEITLTSDQTDRFGGGVYVVFSSSPDAPLPEQVMGGVSRDGTAAQLFDGANLRVLLLGPRASQAVPIPDTLPAGTDWYAHAVQVHMSGGVSDVVSLIIDSATGDTGGTGDGPEVITFDFDDPILQHGAGTGSYDNATDTWNQAARGSRTTLRKGIDSVLTTGATYDVSVTVTASEVTDNLGFRIGPNGSGDNGTGNLTGADFTEEPGFAAGQPITLTRQFTANGGGLLFVLRTATAAVTRTVQVNEITFTEVV